MDPVIPAKTKTTARVIVEEKVVTRIPKLKDIKEGIRPKATDVPLEDTKDLPEPEESSDQTPQLDTALYTKALESYKDKLKAEKKVRELAIFQQPYEVDEIACQVTITFSSELELTLFEDAKFDFTTFIKEELNLPVSISGIVNEALEVERKPYTDREKFEHMARKNPRLLLLKERLGFDTDY